VTTSLLVREVESFLRGELQLAPLGDERRLEGEWRGEPASLGSRCYAGGAIRYGRVTELIARGFEIGSLVFFPTLDRRAPILGVDLVEHAEGGGLFVADLSPVFDGAAPDAAMARAAAELPPAGELPSWAAEVFSKTPIFARVPSAAAAATPLRSAASAFASSVAACAPDGAAVETVRAAQARYVRAHREDDRALGLLAKVFGPERARWYIHEVLFPEVPR